MNLEITGQRFIVCGASSGLGMAVAQRLLQEGAECVLVARRSELLEELFAPHKERISIIQGSVLDNAVRDSIIESARLKTTHGIFINAGGPPTGTPLETTMDDWDAAWQSVMRWKVDLALKITPLFMEAGYGRIVFLESQSVKQPIPVLALSNAFRAGIVGFSKSLALEVASKGVTVNVLAPGSHDTPAIQRVIEKNRGLHNTSYEQTRKKLESSIPVQRMGTAEELATLVAWLFSVHSRYVTGQTISHDGGSISGLFG
jgi:3-oxoacyl-[acyl-carrier protein] reductase